MKWGKTYGFFVCFAWFAMTPKTNKDKVIAPQYRWGFPDVKHMQSLVTYPFTCINYPFWMYLVTSLESKSINHQTILSLYKIITKESFYQKKHWQQKSFKFSSFFERSPFFKLDSNESSPSWKKKHLLLRTKKHQLWKQPHWSSSPTAPIFWKNSWPHQPSSPGTCC